MEVDGGVVLVGGGAVVDGADVVVVVVVAVVVVVESFGFGFDPLPGLSVVVVVVLVVLLVVVSLSGVPRSTEGSSIAFGSSVGAIPAPGWMTMAPPAVNARDWSCGAANGALSHDGNPAGAELPLLVPSEKPSLSVSLFLTSNVAVP